MIIWRGSDISLSSGSQSLWAARVSGVGSITITGVSATPGETLYGEIAIDSAVGSGAPSLAAAAASSWVRFPIHRAVPNAPVLLAQPRSATTVEGETVTLSVSATGDGLTYQWRKDDTAIAGATATTLELKSVRVSDTGSYSVVISNVGGSVTTEAAIVTVTPRIVAPVVASPPASTSIAAGTKVTLSATATGTAPLTYQWFRNSVALPGATQASFTLDRPRPSDAGQYSVTITNSAGSVTSTPADLTIKPVSRISNLSILTSLSSASDNFTLGFVLRGALSADPGGGKPVLIRAVGPSLAPLGVQGALDDPKLELLNGSTLTTSNDNWGGATALSDAFRAAGAFAFASPTSRDAATSTRVNATNNSIRISGTASGLVLAELYDATLADDFEIASPRFANVSVLKNIGSGLTAGFVIDGAEPVQLLVRAIGPALAGFGVAGTVADPKLDLFPSGSTTAIYSNDNWGAATNASQVAAAAISVGAFALAQESKDAVLLVTLAPGSYTAQVSGVNNTTGTALVEVYEVP
jgi:hypothetical protein